MTDHTKAVPESRLVFYHKISMTPTFVPGDILRVVSYGGREIRPGDVIVFPSPRDGEMVTHRVLRVTNEGVITRGDYVRNRIDPWTLKPSEIVGYVAATERDGQTRNVLGGPVGLAYHHAHRALARGRRSLRWLVLRPARLLKLGALLELLRLDRFIERQGRPRVLRITRHGTPELLLLFGNRVVGRNLPGRHGWSIKFWYLPWVNRKALGAATRQALEQPTSHQQRSRDPTPDPM